MPLSPPAFEEIYEIGSVTAVCLHIERLQIADCSSSNVDDAALLIIIYNMKYYEENKIRRTPTTTTHTHAQRHRQPQQQQPACRMCLCLCRFLQRGSWFFLFPPAACVFHYSTPLYHLLFICLRHAHQLNFTVATATATFACACAFPGDCHRQHTLKI